MEETESAEDTDSLFVRLVRRGMVPGEAPPVVSTDLLADCMLTGSLHDVGRGDLEALPPLGNNDRNGTRASRYSAPRLNGIRRDLAIVNPRAYIALAWEIEQAWDVLDAHYDRSPFSLSRPVKNSRVRALTRDNPFAARDRRRRESVALGRFRLRTDISQCYPSVYTHSIPWALTDKATAKARRNDPTLLGNSLDKAARDLMEGQTSGLPIGPDSSLALAEIVLCGIDALWTEAASEGLVGGFRNIDDFELYFKNRGDAERTLTEIERAAAHFELSLNPHKTLIEDPPLNIEDTWKSELLRGRPRSDTVGATTAYLNLLIELIRRHPGDAVLSYGLKVALKQARERTESREAIVHVAMAAAQLSTASMKHTIPLAQRVVMDGDFSPDQFWTFLNEVATGAVGRGHSDEACWSMWGLLASHGSVHEKCGEAIAKTEDPTVAAVYQYLRTIGRAAGPEPELLDRLDPVQVASSDHWLLAYESHLRGWRKVDGIATSPFFERLTADQVTFLPPLAADDEIDEWVDDHPPLTRLVRY